MNENSSCFAEGSCTCGAVRYCITTEPLFVHCCHCRWCQRETGASFALNAMIESDRVILIQGDPEIVDTPSNSGKGQKISRCRICHIALWSNYSGAGDTVRFVRVGTLNNADLLVPDIHIFTSSKQPWVVLPKNVIAVDNYYDPNTCWPKESLDRRAALRNSTSSAS
ncbi:MAG: GFA family protein [Gammaproteobacteria bacterium]|nr:GFA family protein [Gammaproteobacteria bacterium]MDH3465075.1 GFA family protein [Gammaproteobacteria bacterium]